MSSSPRPTLDPGVLVVDRYRVLKPLASGGFGSVFEAERLEDGVHVALKVLHTSLGDDAATAERFRREAALLRELEHPNIVRMLDFGALPEGAPFIALELLRGRPLRQERKRRGPMPTKDVGVVAVAVLEALATAHARGLVHRDIKPANVFLCGPGPGIGEVKLLDFGIAKAIHGDQSALTKLTATGEIIGSVHYMAPEQVLGRAVGPATDLYSLGLVLAELLEGERVVRADTEYETMAAHVEPRAHRLGPRVRDSTLGWVIERAVRKSVAERYASADEMLSDVRESLRPEVTRNEATKATRTTVPSEHTRAEDARPPARGGAGIMEARSARAAVVATSGHAQELQSQFAATPGPAYSGGPLGSREASPSGTPLRMGCLALVGVGCVLVGGFISLTTLRPSPRDDSPPPPASGSRHGKPPAQRPVTPTAAPSPTSLPRAAPERAAGPLGPEAALEQLAGRWAAENGRVVEAVVVRRTAEFRVQDASQFSQQDYRFGESRFKLRVDPAGGTAFVVEDRVRVLPPQGLDYAATAARHTCMTVRTQVDGQPLRAVLLGDLLVVDFAQVQPSRENFTVANGVVVSCRGLDWLPAVRVPLPLQRQR